MPPLRTEGIWEQARDGGGSSGIWGGYFEQACRIGRVERRARPMLMLHSCKQIKEALSRCPKLLKWSININILAHSF
jgi:hypothetical protein